MELVEITWDKVLRVWWSYIWRVLILFVLIGAIQPFIFFPLGMPEFGRNYGLLITELLVIPISILVLKKILSKKFNGFSIALVKNDNA